MTDIDRLERRVAALEQLMAQLGEALEKVVLAAEQLEPAVMELQASRDLTE